MDITEKATQIATSLSKFEDSPVFNYINSLSPFKPVKSIPITQTFNSLNFSSLPSIFTSPHVIAHRETRFLKRNNCSDPSKAGSSSENGNKVFTDDGVAMDASQLYDNSAQLQENFDTGVSIEEDSVEPSSNSKFVIELLRALKYDCSSPGCSSTPCSVIETNSVLEKSRTSDAQDLSIFNYHNESEAFKGLIQKSMDPGERFCSSLVTQFLQNDLSGEPTIQIVDSVGSGQQHEDAQSAQPGESSELKEVNETEDNLANDDLNNCLTGNPSESVGDKVGVCVQDNCLTGVLIEEDSVEPSSNSKFVIELLRALKYDCSSPGCSSTPCSVIETNSVSEKARTSDAQDLLIFNYHNESEAFKGLIQKSMDPGERFCTSLVTQFLQNDLSGEPTIQIVDSVGSGQQHEDAQSAQPGESSELKELNETEDNLANDDLNNCLTGNPSESVGDEVGVCVQDACKRVPTLHRGMLRRSLDFERVARRKNLNDSSNCSSIILQSNEKIASQLVPLMPTSDSPRCILLNALTLASQDNKNFKLEIFSRQLSLPTSTASIHSPESGQEPVQESLTSAAAERDMVPVDDGVPLPEDASQTSSYLVGEESNLNGPKKKRRRMELAGESESVHKRCNCKKSKCLKLYCECFAAGVYCIEPCSCQDCFNKPIHEDTVLATRKQIESRNLLAFAPKVIRNSDSVPEHGDESSKTPASARHKRGCNCKKSSCLKKYCECYQGGVGCSIYCRCEGCKNTFGRKDDDEAIVKKGCGKSFAPFPKGCFFTSSAGLRSFEHPLNELKPVPRVDSSGQVCGSTFKVDAGTKKLAACQESGVLQTGLSSTKLRTVLFC